MRENAHLSLSPINNGVLEEVCPLSARMVVNQVSMKMEDERIRKIISDLKEKIK